ncbi:cystathionine gamma-synthase [Membranihabitans marinus]|uniref:cystathionine gamma-synthase n=1 Tax=Membranihabitans marinus TaxID=1227546 RepID=UPI001EFF7F15|nr:cystathionine gamma-synthase [Membranihabitans marinus]
MKFETKVIHAGIVPDPSTGAIMTPIFQTSTYVQDSPGQHKGFEYARTQNPTRNVLQENLAALENGKHGIAFASGLAAMDSILRLLKTGDEILSTNDLYGGSYRLMTKVFGEYGIKSHFVNMQDAEQVADKIGPNTKLIWIETPTNPLLNIVDIEAICAIAKEKGIMTCVDNTFASPYLQNPLDLGADIVLHSATKYIGGHSDLVLGAVITNNDSIAERLTFFQNAVGAVPGPQDCFLAIRGIKTLALRVERACDNAEKIADFLRNHENVAEVHYPGFADHPGHEVAKKQMKRFGAMISFSIKNDDLAKAQAVLSKTHYFSLAESLGGVESLIGHPSSMTHASIPREERMAVGLLDSTIRLSVGIEHVDDLIQDLAQALA